MSGEQTAPPSRRRFLRIGVGSLMLVILLFGLWLGNRVNRAREQRIAVEAVKASGGFVRYADEFTLGPVNVPQGDGMWKPAWGKLNGKGPTVPERLRLWIGDEYFREVAHVSTFVDIQKGMATAPNSDKMPVDDMLRALGSQPSVRTLQLGGASVTGKGLASVAGLTELRELCIWWATKVDDVAVAPLSSLPHLQTVDISLSPLTDRGVSYLAELPSLENLSLEGQKFTNASLEHLGRAERLKVLYLRAGESEIDDAGLTHLKGLKGLRRLHLQKAKVSPAAKERLLKALPNLEYIP